MTFKNSILLFSVLKEFEKLYDCLKKEFFHLNVPKEISDLSMVSKMFFILYLYI